MPPPAVPVAQAQAIAAGLGVRRRRGQNRVAAQLLRLWVEHALPGEQCVRPQLQVVENGVDLARREADGGAPIRAISGLPCGLTLRGYTVQMRVRAGRVPAALLDQSTDE